MQKFLKDWAPCRRIRLMRTKVCNAHESRINVGFIDVLLSTTPAVEPLTHRFCPELNPAKVLADLSGNGIDETRRRQGQPEGRKELLRTERSGFLFKSAAQLLGSSRPSRRLALIQTTRDLTFVAVWSRRSEQRKTVNQFAMRGDRRRPHWETIRPLAAVGRRLGDCHLKSVANDCSERVEHFNLK